MNFPDVEAFKDYYKPMNQGLWKDLEQKEAHQTRTRG